MKLLISNHLKRMKAQNTPAREARIQDIAVGDLMVLRCKILIYTQI